MHKLVLIRHGESTWNLENRFTGWTDVDLTPLGVEQAQQAARDQGSEDEVPVLDDELHEASGGTAHEAQNREL